MDIKRVPALLDPAVDCRNRFSGQRIRHDQKILTEQVVVVLAGRHSRKQNTEQQKPQALDIPQRKIQTGSFLIHNNKISSWYF